MEADSFAVLLHCVAIFSGMEAGVPVLYIFNCAFLIVLWLMVPVCVNKCIFVKCFM